MLIYNIEEVLDMMKILYPFKKYIDSIDKTRTLKIENIFKVQNRNQLEEVYEFTGDFKM